MAILEVATVVDPSSDVDAQSVSSTERTRRTVHAKGSFDVKATYLPAYETLAEKAIDRFRLYKVYLGDLVGTARGQMIGAGKRAAGTAGYVAVEQVTGKLQGRSGSFALQHYGMMNCGEVELTVRIVPGSGTGDLQGIAGTMTFANEGGKHSYSLDYSVPDSE